MATSGLQIDYGPAGLALSDLPPVFVLWLRDRNWRLPDLHENGGMKALSRRATKMRWTRREASCEEETSPEGLQEVLWQRFFSDTTQWWDNRRSKKTPLHPDFRHKKFKDALWLSNRHKPAWVEPKLAMWDAGLSWPPEPRSTAIQAADGRSGVPVHVDDFEVEVCRKLCEDGLITDAVDALNLLVQRGGRVPTKLLYRVIKRCIAQKDLLLGRRVHALTVESGYEGHAFLATHLISLYASHGRLEEAVGVFAKVSTPSAYNWAAVILACARHGESTRAIRMYQHMRESSMKPDNHIFVAVLKACAASGDLAAGKDVHAHILASAGMPHIFVQTCLVDMYAKCGSLEDARSVFDRLPHRNVVTWNAMIAGYAQQGMGREALSLYSIMLHEGITPPDSVTFTCLLQACGSLGEVAFDRSKQLHAQIEERGLRDDVVIGGSLVNMYAKCGRIDDARKVFDSLPRRNVVTWTAMIAGYSQQGMGQEALKIYSMMQQEGISPPDIVTFVCLLQACASVGEVGLPQGKQLHAQIEERGPPIDVALGGSLVNMYAKCGSIGNAQGVFDKLAHKNMVTWTAMIAGYAQQGMGQEALSIYRSMPQGSIPAVTFVCLLQACAIVGAAALQQGKQLHSQIEERELYDDVVLGGSLVNMYAKCGIIGDARKVFERLPYRNLVAWNAMIAGYAQQGMGQAALGLYRGMQQEGIAPDSVTFVCLLQVCAGLGEAELHHGKQLHAQIEQHHLQADVIIGNSLVKMYSKCSNIEDARRVFDKLPHRNVVTWNLMITGYAQQGMAREALTIYNTMRQESSASPNAVTFVHLLLACATEGEVALPKGKQLHAEIEERGLQDDVIVGASLVNMYVKCCSMGDARGLFNRLPHKNVVTWTAMITGYAQEGMCEEAISLYRSMQQESSDPPNSVTFVCLLQACATVAALPLGKQLHVQIRQQGLQADVGVGTGLVQMYAKCGSMVDSQQVFDLLPERGIAAWGALTAGYARQGNSEVVFDLLDKMRLEGIQPDGITFLSVLTVCSHVGLVDVGRMYFDAMRTDYGIIPTIEHYRCMIDLVGRAGQLDEALQMVRSLPFPPNGAVWLTLLGACRKWNNVQIGRQAFESAVSLDEKTASAYVVMSSIYSSADMWKEAKEMRARRVHFKAWKVPGQSWWTDDGGVLHSFVVGQEAS